MTAVTIKYNWAVEKKEETKGERRPEDRVYGIASYMT